MPSTRWTSRFSAEAGADPASLRRMRCAPVPRCSISPVLLDLEPSMLVRSPSARRRMRARPICYPRGTPSSAGVGFADRRIHAPLPSSHPCSPPPRTSKAINKLHQQSVNLLSFRIASRHLRHTSPFFAEWERAFRRPASGRRSAAYPALQRGGPAFALQAIAAPSFTGTRFPSLTGGRQVMSSRAGGRRPSVTCMFKGHKITSASGGRRKNRPTSWCGSGRGLQEGRNPVAVSSLLVSTRHREDLRLWAQKRGGLRRYKHARTAATGAGAVDSP